MINQRAIAIILVLVLALALSGFVCSKLFAQEEVELKIKTVYGENGRILVQSQNNKGWHRVGGMAKLAAGLDTVTLNTSTQAGKQDVSFFADSTYTGRAVPADTSNRGKSYFIYPISGTQFIIKSSDGTDTATVRWMVEGQ